MDNGGRLIAERSKWLIAGQLILWTATLLLFALAILFSYLGIVNEGVKYIGIYIAWFWFVSLIILGGSVYYSVQSAKTPKVLAEYRNGVILFYPEKSQRYAIRPGDIVFIAQKNYSGRGITYASGKLRIETATGAIALKWVKDVDKVRRAIEELKNTRR